MNRESPDAGDRTGQPSQPTPSDLLNHGPDLGRDATAHKAWLEWGGAVGDVKLVRSMLTLRTSKRKNEQIIDGLLAMTFHHFRSQLGLIAQTKTDHQNRIAGSFLRRH